MADSNIEWDQYFEACDYEFEERSGVQIYEERLNNEISDHLDAILEFISFHPDPNPVIHEIMKLLAEAGMAHAAERINPN